MITVICFHSCWAGDTGFHYNYLTLDLALFEAINQGFIDTLYTKSLAYQPQRHD